MMVKAAIRKIKIFHPDKQPSKSITAKTQMLTHIKLIFENQKRRTHYDEAMADLKQKYPRKHKCQICFKFIFDDCKFDLNHNCNFFNN